MTACEKCWGAATWRQMTQGGSISEHYQAILEENPPCTPAEQCGELHVVPWGKLSCRCGAKTVDVAPMPDRGAP